MTRERLIEMMDLVLQCDRWGASHRVHLLVDNYGQHEMYLYPNVGNGGKSTVFIADSFFPLPDEEGYVLDPNFEKAEKEIRRLMEEIKMP